MNRDIKDPRIGIDYALAVEMTKDDGVDYGLLAGGDAAYFVWREEMDKTKVLRNFIERIEATKPLVAAKMSYLHDTTDQEMVYKTAVLFSFDHELYDRSKVMRAVECGLIDYMEFLRFRSIQSLKKVLEHSPEKAMELLKAISSLRE